MPFRLTMKRLVSTILLICFTSDASEVELLTEIFPPYNYVDQDRVVGINTDILYRACNIASVRCSFSLLPWNRAFILHTQKRTTAYFLLQEQRIARTSLFGWDLWYRAMHAFTE